MTSAEPEQGVTHPHLVDTRILEVPPSKASLAAELLLSSQQLVVLGQVLGSARGTSFDLTSGETHYQISNEGVFCLSRAVAHHHTPAIGLGQLAAARDQEMKLTPCPVPISLCSSDTAQGQHRTARWHRAGSQDKVLTRSCCHADPGKLFRAPV